MNSVLSWVIFITIMATSSTLKCYNCNSFNDTACADPFRGESSAVQTAFLEECQNTTEDGTKDVVPFCRKVSMHINDAHTRIKRDCGYKRREGHECYQKRAEDYTTNVCQCDHDMCNGANSHAFVSVLVIFGALFVLFF
ncbi:unnamed protein product [Meganyctiphanes norvegica]|uniref:Protein sleepless n=1 Tax=Meganyctiphanes norvegica TaxID=48144 RepID=A0AAV2SDI9_MEGNR